MHGRPGSVVRVREGKINIADSAAFLRHEKACCEMHRYANTKKGKMQEEIRVLSINANYDAMRDTYISPY
jgi:hypothetical protein